MKNKVIAIVGPHYSGKSTLCDLLQKKEGYRVIKEDWWNDPFRDLVPRDYFKSQMWFLYETARRMRTAKELGNKGKSIVLDTFIYSTLIFATTKLKEAELALFKKFFELVDKVEHYPDVIIYLYADIDFLFNVRRVDRVKKGTGPAGEINTSYNWLAEVCRLHDKYFSKWKKTKIIKVNVKKTDFVGNKKGYLKIVKEINQ